MEKRFLDLDGLRKILDRFTSKLATTATITEIKETTDEYIFGSENVDYSVLSFDTSFIISGGAASPTINVGQVGYMVIAASNS